MTHWKVRNTMAGTNITAIVDGKPRDCGTHPSKISSIFAIDWIISKGDAKYGDIIHTPDGLSAMIITSRERAIA